MTDESKLKQLLSKAVVVVNQNYGGSAETLTGIIDQVFDNNCFHMKTPMGTGGAYLTICGYRDAVLFISEKDGNKLYENPAVKEVKTDTLETEEEKRALREQGIFYF
jgi:hypothetical protein